MAKANAKKAAPRRRERKNIERGAAHIQSTFNNTILTITDTHSFRSSDCSRNRCKSCYGSWSEIR